MTRAKRYLKRNYHPAFDYYIGAEIVKKQETRTVKTNAPGMYGRPDLCSESTETDLPLAMTVTEAQAYFERREPFAFITPSGRAGWQDTESYERHANEQPDWNKVTDCYEQVVKGRLRYV